MKRLKIFFLLLISLVIFIFFHNSSAQDIVNVSVICKIPCEGPCLSGVIKGNTAYFGNGIFLQMADFSNPDQPVTLSKINVSDHIQDIAVKGNYAYVSSMMNLKVIDISDPVNPFETGSCKVMGRIVRITLVDNYAYLALEYEGFQIIDISDPSNPVELKSSNNELAWWKTDDATLDIAVKDNFAYIADANTGLRIINVSNPFKMRGVGFYDMPDIARSVEIKGNYAYVANSRRGLSIINIADSINPSEENIFDTEEFAWDVAVSGNQAIVADQNGLQFLDIINPANPIETEFIELPQNTRRVNVKDDYACIPNYAAGFYLINISAPNNPSIACNFETGDEIFDLDVSNGILYMAKGSEGLYVIDISAPYDPKEKSIFNSTGIVNSVKVQSNLVYITDGEGLRIVNVSDANNPFEIGTFNSPGNAQDVFLRNNYAYLADGTEGLRIIDISNSSQPLEKGHFNTNGNAQAVAVSGNYAYIADGDSGLRIVDLSKPDSPVEIGNYNTQGITVGVVVDSHYVYTVDAQNGLYIIDAGNPSQPYQLGHIEFTSASSITINGDYIYLTDSYGGLFIIDVSDPANPITKGSFNPPGFSNSVVAEERYVYLGASGDGIYICVNELLQQPFLTQKSGVLKLSIFGDGNIGHDHVSHSGDGCYFHTSGDALYAGSFMVGNSDRIHGMIYNKKRELLEAGNLEGFFSDSHFSEIAHASFCDAGADQPFDILIKQNTYAGNDNDFIYFQYEIQNQSGEDLNGMYAALFLDWDIGDAYSNKGGIDLNRELAYQYEADVGQTSRDPFYYGVIALSGMAGVRITPSEDYTSQDSLYSWINSSLEPSKEVIDDCRMYVGSGPYNIPSGSVQDVWFCIIGARTYNEIFSRSDYAIQQWKDVFTGIKDKHKKMPDNFYLAQNYPNPFNPKTVICYQLPKISKVYLSIYNLLGQKIATLVSKEQPAGYYDVEWNASGYASGVYLYRLKTDKGFVQTRKLVLLK